MNINLKCILVSNSPKKKGGGFMPALQVKHFPQDLYDELKTCAAKEDRSISQQTVHILRDYLRAYRQWSNRSDWEVIPKNSEAFSAYHDRIMTRRESEEVERQARIEKRKKIFEKIENASSFDLPEEYSSEAELVHGMREERDAQIFAALGSMR